jgi:hypothetical protein
MIAPIILIKEQIVQYYVIPLKINQTVKIVKEMVHALVVSMINFTEKIALIHAIIAQQIVVLTVHVEIAHLYVLMIL